MSDKNYQNFSYHVVFWIVYILYENTLLHFAGMPFRLAITVVGFAINAAVFYGSFYAIMFSRKRAKNKLLMAIYIIAAISLILCISTSIKIVLESVIEHKNLKALTDIYISSQVMRSIYFILLGIGFGFTRLALVKEKEYLQHQLFTFNLKQQMEDADKKALKAELNLLKAQINPHFIFNTLGFLYSQTYKVVPRVGKSILMLSNIMRHSLTSTGEYCALEGELNYIKEYIILNKERVEMQFLNYSLECNPGHIKVVSLILLTLVENLFKHGLLNQEDKAAVLDISVKGDMLVYHSCNYKNNNKHVSSSGIGMDYIRKLLTEKYQNAYSLHIAENEKTYECELKFPIIRDEAD
jgi:two-component system LytT family sensor kinase